VLVPLATVLFKTEGTRQYRDVSRRLREAGRGDLQRKLTRAVKSEGQPALAAVRAAWLGVHVTPLPPNDRGGHGRPDTSTGLRRRVAAATQIQARQNGISIFVNAARVDPNYPSLPYYLNGFPRKRPWRHMVFGNKNVWVAQRGQEVLFPTLMKFAPVWRQGCLGAMNDTIRQIEGR
jgi:hypothetical protein